MASWWPWPWQVVLAVRAMGTAVWTARAGWGMSWALADPAVALMSASPAMVKIFFIGSLLRGAARRGARSEAVRAPCGAPDEVGIAVAPVAGAQALSEFAKDNENFIIKGGSMPNALMSAKDIKALATMPSRDELIATLLGTMQAPIAKFVRTLNEVPTKFVRALAAVRDQKQGAAA